MVFNYVVFKQMPFEIVSETVNFFHGWKALKELSHQLVQIWKLFEKNCFVCSRVRILLSFLCLLPNCNVFWEKRAQGFVGEQFGRQHVLESAAAAVSDGICGLLRFLNWFIADRFSRGFWFTNFFIFFSVVFAAWMQWSEKRCFRLIKRCGVNELFHMHFCLVWGRYSDYLTEILLQ